MKFINDKHEAKFIEFCNKMKRLDEYHKSVAYLLALDTVCSEHVADLFDFSEDMICFDGLSKSWQTNTSSKTTRLIYNLWNGYCYDGETGMDNNFCSIKLVSKNYTVDNIFNCSYAPYYFEAVCLRYPMFFDAI